MVPYCTQRISNSSTCLTLPFKRWLLLNLSSLISHYSQKPNPHSHRSYTHLLNKLLVKISEIIHSFLSSFYTHSLWNTFLMPTFFYIFLVNSLSIISQIFLMLCLPGSLTLCLLSSTELRYHALMVS